MSDRTPDYDHTALRLKAMQARNVERIIQAARHQRRALAADGLPEPAWAALDASIAAQKPVLAQLKREMVAIVRGSALHGWTKETKGLGPGLFYALGQMPPLVEFTGPAKVWRYCGLDVRHADDPETDGDGNYLPGQGRAPRRKRGEVAGFSPQLRSAVLFRVADPIVKVGGPYRAVYDDRRGRTEETRPEWTDGHRHADAMRVMAKAVLRDAWRVAHGKAPRASASEDSTPDVLPPGSGGRTVYDAHKSPAPDSGDPAEAA